MTDQLIFRAQVLVRETGYNLCILKEKRAMGEDYSRALVIYQEACNLLRFVAPDAEDFINKSYNPRNTNQED